MIYREYGKTGKKISAVGFGGMRFERPDDFDRSAEMLVHALNKGINYFDTATFYFKGKSEEIFGHARSELVRTGKNFYYSTKSMAKDRESVRIDVEHSLKRMKVDSIDFLHVWCVLTPEDFAARKAAGVIDEFRKVKEEGLAKHISISTHMSGNEIRDLFEHEEFEGVTLGYCATNFPFREAGLKAAIEKNMGAVIMNPLGGGTIVNNPEAFSFIRMNEEQSMVDAALHFLLSNKGITSALVGFSNKQQIDEAVAAVESFKPYTAAESERLKQSIQDDFQSMCTTCGYCNVCPVNIPVWAFMESFNHVLLDGSFKVAERLKWHWALKINELDRCTGCRQCEEVCTQHLPILQRFELIRQNARGK
ncbi:MAG: aldo/keto reductase [Spirochaetales bacterium]|uniref:Aldo/keto reductase n=1 Tax=Candidatus Thalassospirochaeta sargassi TaxID=3119039 RepID=A0AAJ1MJ32_9SPIO|nr:aldo/keto reductase [Spirochaetales bacterium]